MPSLAEAYERRAGAVSRRRLLLGTGLFATGALLLVAGTIAGATPLLPAVGFRWWEAREVAGVLAGLGFPAVCVGIVAVLPANDTQRATAAAGAGLAVLGVVLFRAAYPYQWYGAARVPSAFAMLTVAVYFVGAIATFWTLFAAVATFKRRNDPGGTVTLEFSSGGERRTVEVAADDARAAREAIGGVGVFGGIDDPDRGDAGEAAARDGGPDAETIRTPGADADPGGGQTPGDAAGPDDIRTPGDDVTASGRDREPADGSSSARSDASGTDIRGPGADTVGERDQRPGAAGRGAGGSRSGDADAGRGGSTDGRPGQGQQDRYCGTCTHFEYVRTESGMQPYCAFHDEAMDDMAACSEWTPNRS